MRGSVRVEAIPSVEGAFDVAVANFMLYHVADLGRALGELARVAPALVAATMGFDQLREMWNLVGRDLGRRQGLLMRETGEQRPRLTMRRSEWSTSRRPSR